MTLSLVSYIFKEYIAVTFVDQVALDDEGGTLLRNVRSHLPSRAVS
jgi:hypothetical protein